MINTLIWILSATIRISIPVLLAALGGLITQQVGIINIALEGFALFGAFFTIAFSLWLMNTWLGVLFGALSSSLLSLLFGLIIIRYQANKIISAIGINIFASGITLFLLKAFFNTTGALFSKKIVSLPKIDIPIINKIPILNPIINNHTPLVYLAFFMIFIIHFFLFYTPLGLTFRGIGNNSKAAKSAGINVNKSQYIAILFSGALCGLAGAHLATGYVTMFSEGMTAGRGFIAFIAVIFGNAKPIPVALVCIFFGFAEALALRLQLVGLPSQLIMMIPYILAVIAIAVASALPNKNIV